MSKTADTLYLKINRMDPEDYLQDVRVGIMVCIRTHFESPGDFTTDEERFYMGRVTDFLIYLTKGKLVQVDPETINEVGPPREQDHTTSERRETP
ncbi:MAG: hypothetical protein AAF998_25565 [Bacteroidota bacterium]